MINLATDNLIEVQRALQNPDTLATTVHAIMMAQYGPESYLWDPVCTLMELKADFGVDVESSVIDRFAAMSIVMLSDAFFKRMDSFLGVCNTFANGQPYFQVFDPVTTEEAAWSLVEVALNRELLPFGYPVRKYLRLILKQDGYQTDEDIPDIFSEALEINPSSIDLKRELVNPVGRTALETYVLEQVQEVQAQLQAIPALAATAAELLADTQYPDDDTNEGI